MSASSNLNTRVLLKSRPVGEVTEANFEIQRVPIPTLVDGQILVQNHFMSIDPAMRGWMNDQKSYIEPVRLGDVMRASSVGQVVDSLNPKFAKGDLVLGMLGWQDYAVTDGKGLQKIVQIPGHPLSVYLGAIGGTGLSAYFGLLKVGQPKAGETVLVSAAAGAVGSAVGQIAKVLGCRVVGLAGSQDKCDWLVKELGFDAVINYKTTKNLNADIGKACPNGIDVYFDNVGGVILDTALRRINKGARIVVCGAISQYNADKPVPGPSNYLSLLVNRARMEGFVVFDYKSEFVSATRQLAQWLVENKLKYTEHVVDGVENAPKALRMLFDGSNNGKLLVRNTVKPSSKL
eukprot:TRINITY_DN1099_c0_g1_i1.p1 TRINITY_DN1099_c0_g1~~TRINITY_DN1099_c0_g1_i1.p1  ORF type:complete len:347 (+),score=92.89 TRINITY_DN1099_c0_g1_i1:63-1103(+)